MSTACLNCGSKLNDSFCSHCGQKADVKRLTWHSLGEEIFHFFTHIEKGFVLTTRQLIMHPGQLCKNYLDGKRKQYHKPISFLLVWITIFILIYHLAISMTHYPMENTASLFTFGPEAQEIIGKYRSIVEILILPFLAFVSWLIVARPRLNYVEILSVFFYFTSFLFVLLSVQFTVAIICSINFRTNTFDLVTTGTYLAWLIYAGYDFYKRYKIPYLIPRTILALIVGSQVYFPLAKLIARAMIALHF